MLLTRYSKNPHHALCDLSSLTCRKRTLWFKPSPVFWFSEDSRGNGWADWCLGEKFHTERLAWRCDYDVRIQNFHVIDTKQKLFDFSRKYGVWNEIMNVFVIDWEKAQKGHDGILCIPYCREWQEEDTCFLTLWYSALDCDCACVWNPDSIVWAGIPEKTHFA